MEYGERLESANMRIGSEPLVNPLTVQAFDSLTEQMQVVGPGAIAKLYVCGITPYDATHIGHANTYVAFDLLNRAWRAAGKQVVYTQNITDVDDPLLERATATGVDWRELAASQMELFAGDMAALDVIAPENWIPVTKAMPDIIEAITLLLRSGAAYFVSDRAPDEKTEITGFNCETDTSKGSFRDIYFDITTDADFGVLSGYRKPKMLELFAERGGDPGRPGKRNPLDPLLWRAHRPSEPSWEGGALGQGRPGWHIGCTVIAGETLGEHFDVLAGGSDLLFPHHEMSESLFRVLLANGWLATPKPATSEAAKSEFAPAATPAQSQAELANPTPNPARRFSPPDCVGAHAFLHSGMVSYQGTKMSKSLGNLVIVSDLIAGGVDPMAIRLALLAHHYRSDWEWTDAVLAEAQQRLETWRHAAWTEPGQLPAEATNSHFHQTTSALRAAIQDDLNAPSALEIVDEYLANTNQPSWAVKESIEALLGVTL